MNNVDVIRAWKDETYRASLSEEDRIQLPANPAGVIEINEKYLRGSAQLQPPTCCCFGWTCAANLSCCP